MSYVIKVVFCKHISDASACNFSPTIIILIIITVIDQWQYRLLTITGLFETILIELKDRFSVDYILFRREFLSIFRLRPLTFLFHWNTLFFVVSLSEKIDSRGEKERCLYGCAHEWKHFTPFLRIISSLVKERERKTNVKAWQNHSFSRSTMNLSKSIDVVKCV